jgi:hypothetical protein
MDSSRLSIQTETYDAFQAAGRAVALAVCVITVWKKKNEVTRRWRCEIPGGDHSRDVRLVFHSPLNAKGIAVAAGARCAQGAAQER